MEASNDFWMGALAGFVAAGLLGFSLQLITFHFDRIQNLGQPQRIVTETNDTPGQVVGRAVVSGCILVIIVLALLGLCWWVLILSPGETNIIR